MTDEIIKIKTLFDQIHEHLLSNMFQHDEHIYKRCLEQPSGQTLYINGQMMTPQTIKINIIIDYLGPGELMNEIDEDDIPVPLEVYDFLIEVDGQRHYNQTHCFQEFEEFLFYFNNL